MNLYPEITRRKSSRQYDMTPLDNTKLAQIKAFADKLTPLDASVKTAYRFAAVTELKGMFSVMPVGVKAPHYLVVSSEKKEGYLLNAGFMYQQLALYLSFMGLGSVWLGSVKPSVKPAGGMEDIIVLAFGKTYDTPYRNAANFKRKAPNTVSNGNFARIEPARLAPSGFNSQPWYFFTDEKNKLLHVFCKKNNALTAPLFKKMNSFSMGLALCHMWMATTNMGRAFNFVKDRQGQAVPPRGYYYVGTMTDI